MLSGLGIGGESQENVLLDLDKTYALRVPNLRKFGLFKCAGQNELFDIVADYGTVAKAGLSVFNQHNCLFSAKSNINFDKFVGEVPNSVRNLIRDVFRCESLYNKAGNFSQSVAECGYKCEQSGLPIVYFHNDESELKVTIHEKCMSKDVFFELVEVFVKNLKDYNIKNIVATVFSGNINNYYKTQYKKEIKCVLKQSVFLQELKSKYNVVGVGKVLEYFDKDNFSVVYPTKADDLTLKISCKEFNGKDVFVYAELCDFYNTYIRHGDLLGARQYLENFDNFLGDIIKKMKDEDRCIITSDIELNQDVPIFVYYKNSFGKNLGRLKDFSAAGELLKSIF